MQTLLRLQCATIESYLPANWDLATSGSYGNSARNWFSILCTNGRVVCLDSDESLSDSLETQREYFVSQLKRQGILETE